MARVLLIDDDPLIQTTLPLVLAEHGHEVIVTSNGKQALKEIRTRPPEAPIDVVITDILMPETDGLEVIRALRTESPNLPVVAMSGGSSRMPGTEALHLARLLGARQVLAKPFTEGELLSAIRLAVVR
jgi:DNA-binding response OmpR family regulator